MSNRLNARPAIGENDVAKVEAGSHAAVGGAGAAEEFYFQGTNGKGVLLIHGLTGAPVEMRFVGKTLNRMGYTVYAPRLAGHGVDIDTLIKTTHRDWIDGLGEPLNRLKAECDEVSTAGICVGGALGLMLAHSEPGRVARSVVYAPALQYDGWNQPWWQRYINPVIRLGYYFPALYHLTFEEKAPFGIKDERMRRFLMEGASMKGVLPCFPIIALYENMLLNDALRKALPAMTTPTLLIHSREDDVSNPRNAERIKALHGGPVELVYLQNSYHMVHVDQERELVARLTGEFIGGLSVEASMAGYYENHAKRAGAEAEPGRGFEIGDAVRA
jgi:carboxylesterase